ncbi:MAG: aminotransferase class V-fold PLP-dependent enzyme [Spirochaetales bacterium]|nr:aminotransferase class V-fold PLP-dependent enzyme [Spirochaetales bacterium]
MKRVYMDNASTSFPKAPGTAEAMTHYINDIGANLNRGEYSDTFSSEEHINNVRRMIADMFGSSHPECVAFTLNVTSALNTIISGLSAASKPVLISSMEHNAVLRPLVRYNVPFVTIPSDAEGHCIINNLKKSAKEGAGALIIQSASNVSGTIQDIPRIAEIAHAYKLLLIVDAAQGSPHVPLNLEKMGIDAICFAGHKGLLGPQGTGGMILSPMLADRLLPLIAGGTGSRSFSEKMPSFMPDKFEAGTQNIPGLFGLECAIDYERNHHEEIESNLQHLTSHLIDGLLSISGIRILGPAADEARTPVVSLTSDLFDIAELARLLEETGNIQTRVGLHCAPLAHRSLGSYPSGALRLSPGPFSTAEEIDFTLDILKCCMQKLAVS